MTFPTTSVLDSFDRADGGLGSNWSTPTFVTGFNISSNVAFGATTANIQYYNVATYGADFEIFADVSNLPGSGEQCGLIGGTLQATSAITLLRIASFSTAGLTVHLPIFFLVITSYLSIPHQRRNLQVRT